MDVLIGAAAWELVRGPHDILAMKAMDVTVAESVAGATRRMDRSRQAAAPIDGSPIAGRARILDVQIWNVWQQCEQVMLRE